MKLSILRMALNLYLCTLKNLEEKWVYLICSRKKLQLT